MFVKLAVKSLLDRKGSVILALAAMTVSVFVLLGVEHIRHQTKDNFANTVSGVDLIVGARTGSLNLLLYSVFRIGSPTNNISWDTYQKISSSRHVEWAVPISLGDSHKGYRVMGTSQDYFKHFSYGNKHRLEFRQGRVFDGVFDVVLGSEVARQLNYSLGEKLVFSHGIAATSFSVHDDRPFEVVGILEATGTPVDQTLHVSLAGMEAIHIDWKQGVRMPGKSISNEQLQQLQLEPKQITAFMVGLKSKMVTFRLQRDINNYGREPLMAILPGVALSELWQMISVLERTLRLVSVLVFVAALLGLSAMLLASIRERKKEIQLLRVIGAPPGFLFLLIEIEALLISVLSIALGGGSLSFGLWLAQDALLARYGLPISAHIMSPQSSYMMLAVLVATFLVAAIPAYRAFSSARCI